MEHKETLNKILKAITDKGGVPFFVGGFVRDSFLGKESKDIDIEVFGIQDLKTVFPECDTIGESFSVIKIDDFDISLPRRERKISKGHKGFEVEADPFMSIEEASLRRDFTFNAIYKNADTDEIIDPHGGLKDLKNKVLRPTSERFKEDPLRVLRGFQFSARFGFKPTDDFVEFSKELLSEFDTLSKERLWVEFEKWATKGVDMVTSLDLLKDSQWITKFTELNNLIDLKQDPTWHPEGDVFTHTKLVCQAATEIAVRENICKTDRLVLLLSALCHDMGKAITTQIIDGKIKSPAHAIKGVDLAKNFLESIKAPNDIIKRVCLLVETHMFHTNIQTKKSIKRLIIKLGDDIDLLMMLGEADLSGRTPLPKGKSQEIILAEEILKDIKSNPINTTKPFITGKDLFDLGFKQGKELGDLKREMFDLQIDKDLNREELLEMLKMKIK